jgi:hypothetical protein
VKNSARTDRVPPARLARIMAKKRRIPYGVSGADGSGSAVVYEGNNASDTRPDDPGRASAACDRTRKMSAG